MPENNTHTIRFSIPYITVLFFYVTSAGTAIIVPCVAHFSSH